MCPTKSLDAVRSSPTHLFQRTRGSGDFAGRGIDLGISRSQFNKSISTICSSFRKVFRMFQSSRGNDQVVLCSRHLVRIVPQQHNAERCRWSMSSHADLTNPLILDPRSRGYKPFEPQKGAELRSHHLPVLRPRTPIQNDLLL